MSARLPLITDPATARDPVMCRRHHELPESIYQALAGHGLPLWVVLATAFARVVADWSSQPQIRFTVPPDRTVSVDMDPRRSFLDCANDIRAQLQEPATTFAAGSWLIHRIDDGLTWDTDDGLFVPVLHDQVLVEEAERVLRRGRSQAEQKLRRSSSPFRYRCWP